MELQSPKTENYREIVTFRLADQDFCIDIMEVREIRCWSPATTLPHAPPYVRGLINLRGAVLPVIDLAERLGMAARELTERHVIIVVMLEGQLIGLIVDSVSDILSITESDLQVAPAMGTEADQDFVKAIMAVDDRMIRMLDLTLVCHTHHDEVA